MADVSATAAARYGFGPSSDPITPEYAEAYWESVQDTLTHVFEASEDEVIDAMRELRTRYERAPRETQLYLFHVEPLQVAADILGAPWPLTADRVEAYVRLRTPGAAADRPRLEDIDAHLRRVEREERGSPHG